MASNNSYSIEGWADRMTAHLQGLNIKAAEIEKQAMFFSSQPIVVSQAVIDFLKRFEKQQNKEKHMAEIKSAGNNYNL